MGERVVAPFLWSQGVRQVDLLVLSHAHPDHAGGVPFLLRAFPVRETWEGIAPRRDEGYAAFAARSLEAGARRVAVARGVTRDWDGVRLEVRGPLPSGVRPLRTRNDDSVVLVVRFGEVCAVLTGDIEAAAERTLDLPRCSILKVPHHGSRTSTTEALLASVRPRLGILSAGARNRFGHPHPDVVGRLRTHGVMLLRTDRDGTVRLSTDGRRVWVRRGRGGVEERAL
jgi:competence protein ComEC